MEQAVAATDLAALDRKLDVLTAQVDYLTEQAQRAARRQEERAGLLHDALPLANDALELVTEQLEEVKEYVDLCDLLRLVKRLLRNGRNLDKMLDQLESLMDLAQTVGPLTDQAFEKATDLLQKAEQRGYFEVARKGGRAVDDMVTSLSAEEETPPLDASWRALLRQMRDPDVRRGLAMTMRVLGVLGKQAAAT
jgi:uncharacterized protein YjgD (DUF1641 family)